MDNKLVKESTWDYFIVNYYWVLILLVVFVLSMLILLFWYIRRCRREPRYEYTALGEESFLQDRLEMDRKLQKDSDRNMSIIRCQYFLRGSNRYVFIRHLPDVGSRLEKNWFLVRDNTTKTERLLTMAPMAENCPIKYKAELKQAFLELFRALQHPYIYPVLDIDCKTIMDQEYVVAVIPFNDKGTLKDVIYQSHCQDDWKEKYHYHGCGLEAAQIQRLGCQILEGLLFLKDQGFPPFLHLHTGNVILQNGVARISALENTLFGYISRSHAFIPKRLQDNKEAIETICFAQLLFEMASGYELTTCHLSEKNYEDIEHNARITGVLKFIFEQGRYRYPTLQQVAGLEFFRHIDLRELRSITPVPSFRAKLSPATRGLLKEIKRHQRSKKRSKRSQSLSTLETASVDSRDSRSSGSSSNRAMKRKKRQDMTSPETMAGELFHTQLHTLPLTDIEGSMASQTATSLCGSLEYYTPPTTPLPATMIRPTSEHSSSHSLFLQEIQTGVKLKHVQRDPEV